MVGVDSSSQEADLWPTSVSFFVMISGHSVVLYIHKVNSHTCSGLQ